MFNRTYKHSEYTQDIKSNVRYVTEMAIKTENLSYVNYFLPEVLSTIPYFAPIITSYLDTQITGEKNIDPLVEQLIIIRLICIINFP